MLAIEVATLTYVCHYPSAMQYAGAVMTIFGAGILLITEEHASRGFGAVGIMGALYYLFMSIIEVVIARGLFSSRHITA